jgi:hypothetical protein
VWGLTTALWGGGELAVWFSNQANGSYKVDATLEFLKLYEVWPLLGPSRSLPKDVLSKRSKQCIK